MKLWIFLSITDFGETKISKIDYFVIIFHLTFFFEIYIVYHKYYAMFIQIVYFMIFKCNISRKTRTSVIHYFISLFVFLSGKGSKTDEPIFTVFSQVLYYTYDEKTENNK